MPIFTPNYNLAAFLSGEPYLSKYDKSRFSDIDFQLEFLSRNIGNGVISGWEVTDATAGGDIRVQVAFGNGIINKFVTNTYGNIIASIIDDTVNYIYLQRKPKTIGYNGPFSLPDSFAFTDIVAPVSPVGLALSNVTSSSIHIDWDDNTEADLSHYVVDRSSDGAVSWSTIASPVVSEYDDTGLSDNTEYRYRLFAVDNSGNTSVASALSIETTLQDTIPAAAPQYLICLSGDSQISCIWGEYDTPTPNEITLKLWELDFENNKLGSATSVTLDISEHIFVFESLSNDINYLVELYPVNKYDQLSDPLSSIVSPSPTSGPAEVTDTAVSFNRSSSNPRYVTLDLSWEEGIDPYKSVAFKYSITIVENGGTKISDPIYVFENTTDVVLDAFQYNGMTYPFLERTDYIIKIQAEDEDGNLNNGTLLRIFVEGVIVPKSPININAIYNTEGLFFNWLNKTANLSYNLISITDRDISAGTETALISDFNNGNASGYQIEFSDLNPNHKYTIIITPYDTDGNIGGDSTFPFTIDSLNYRLAGGRGSTTDNPPPVSRIYAFSGDGCVLVIWSPIDGVDIANYKIWRAPFTRSQYYDGSEFVLIDTVPNTVNSFVDYNIANGNRFTYMITIIDVFGNESVLPTDAGFETPDIANSLGIKGRSDLSRPTNVGVTNPVNFDAAITWFEAEGDFDCYEIYYSPLNQYSWEKVDTVDNDVLTYTHTDAFIDGDGDYYYMVRASRNEARVVVNTTEELPTNSILLAKVTASFGAITEIEDLSSNLYQMEDYILDLLTPTIANHKHFYSSVFDRRIDLNSSIVITDWSTVDQQKYTTTEILYGKDGSGDNVYASYYIVKVDDITTSIPYEVIPDDGEIIFNQATGSDNISVMVIGINETTGILPKERVKSFVAAQSESGRLQKETLPDIAHDGRYNEELIPLQLPMTSTDGYTYKIYQNVHTPSLVDIGGSVTFYDFIEIDSGITAATSKGLYFSDDDGTSWTLLRTTFAPVHKLYYDSTKDRYFGISNNEIYVSDDGTGWSETSGLEWVSVIRDIVGDGTYTYVTSDIGVYALKNDSYGELFVWQQLTLYSGKSTDTYAIFYDSHNNKILVSTEIGLFQSFNNGSTWAYTNEIDEFFPMWQFIENNNFIFAISNVGIWRRHISATSFTQVTAFSFDMVRRVVIFENRLLITTSEGLMVSNEDQSIYYNMDLIFENTELYNVKFSNKTPAIFGMTNIDNILYIGTDNRVFTATILDEIELVFESTGLIPTFYLDEKEQIIGCYYSSDNDLVYFDRKIWPQQQVSVANQYKLFKAKNKSWVGQYYNPDVRIYDKTGLVAFLVNGNSPLSVFNSVVFDTFVDETSNSEIANQYVTEYNLRLADMQAIVGGTTDDADGSLLRSAASDCERLYQKVYSQMFGDIRFGTLITYQSRSYLVIDNIMYLDSIADDLLSNYEVIEELPSFYYESIIYPSISANGSNGIIEFASTSFDKYNSLHVYITRSSLIGDGANTHKTLENTFELYNSGLTYDLSFINQCNILKTGLFIDNELGTINTYQSQYFLPSTLNWYDIINSTIDYNKEIDCASVGVDSIGYPTAVLYDSIANKVFVGHKKGVVSIDVITLDVLDVSFNFNGEDEYVQDIQLIDEVIYIITNEHMYLSSDHGVSWYEYGTYGITGQFRRISIYGNQMVFATSEGIFYKYIDADNWEQVSSAPNVSQFIVDKGIFAISNGVNIYYSVNAIDWHLKGYFGTSSTTSISKIEFMRDIAFMATSKGLRYDSGTLYSSNLDSSLVDLEGDVAVSGALKINSVAINSDLDGYIAGGQNGKYYQWDSTTDVITFAESGLNEIYKIIRVEDDFWLFGNGTLRVLSLSFPINISTGVPS